MIRKTTAMLLCLYLCAGYFFGAGALEALPAPEDSLLFQDSRFESVEPLPDGGYLVVGCTLKNPGEDASIGENYWAWAARVNAQGEVLWENTYQAGGTFTEVVSLADGSYLLGMEHVFQDFSKLAVVQVDALGQLLGDPVPLRTPGFFYKGIACLILQEAPDDFAPGDAPALQAVGARGETLWRQAYPGLTGSGYFVRPTIDGYLLAGSIQDYPYDQSSLYPFAAKLDKTGALLWQGQASEAPGSSIQSYVEMPDGGILGIGTSNNGVRFDASGFVDWYREYPRDDVFVRFDGLWAQPDGRLLVLGDAASRDGGGIFLFELDGTGEVLNQWHQPIFPNGYLVRSQLFGVGDRLYHIGSCRTDDEDASSPYITTVLELKLPE